jgi:uroporphyrinogen decarboxylase
MNSKEIVRRTLDYDGPDRIAHTFGDSDFVQVEFTCTTHATDWKENEDGSWDRTDEWGNLWRRIDPTSKGEVAKGVLESLDDIHDYKFPDFSKPEDYKVVTEAKEKHPDKWIVGLMPGFAFNIARKLRRLDQYMMEILLEREKISAIHDRIDVVFEDMIKNYARAGADSVFFLEDWGTQQHLMISPKLWEEEFFPRYQKMCKLAKDEGIRVFMHSCGNISDIIPKVMESGVELLQFDQPDLYGIDNLANFQEMGKITFWCPVDIQTTLQTKDEKLIREKSDEMLDKLWKGRGGFLAGYYEDNESIGLDPEIQSWACDEFDKKGRKEQFS